MHTTASPPAALRRPSAQLYIRLIYYVEELAREWVRGASWYLERAVDIVSKVADPLPTAERLRGVRPGMAPLDFLYLVLREAVSRGVDARAAAARVAAYAKEARDRLSRGVQSLRCMRRVATVSFSSAVERLLRGLGCVDVVYLAESRPGAEFAEAYAAYSRYAQVVPIPDAAVGAFDYDAAVVGLDGLYLDAAVNKVGTLPLLAAARWVGALTIAVFESYKAVPLMSPPPMRVAAEVAGHAVEVPLFDRVPHGLIDVYVTDLGLFTEAEPLRLYRLALEKVFM
ncbi:initiation factor 2B related [Pyrobaculum neutrophilum]|uniref:Initiation factor 2B related n=1 Tax=Pyrobaculum neutrophilum (strain DSM 2338 / JCM 9278 / NBRC 100436 / V24Sta) TaxID=444157 RepID=B1YB83_PYRNV|nr:initiation factor 2B related [Pyrobaculum neutrophilum]ACB39214.1 initiation factor 2B related [Pyrobaculum neutrophilum V24Sta]